MEDSKEKLDNTIKIIADVLEANKDNENVKESYEDIQRLKEKRNIG